MPNINTHRGVNKKWDAYRNGHNSFVMNFTASSVAVDQTANTYVCNIKRTGASTNELQLTEGAGITNGGVTGIVSIALTKTQIETYLPGADYFYEIIYTNGGLQYGLLQGGLALHSQSNPGTSTTSLDITVNMGGVNVDVEVLNGSNVTSSEITTALGYTPANASTLSSHIANTSNPHQVNLSHLGLGKTIEDFGAVGDGVTDDSAAIQTAVNSGDWVWVPNNTNGYLCNTSISIPAKAVIKGCGYHSRIKTTANITIFNINVDNSYCTIENITFQGDRSTTTRTSQNGIAVIGDLATVFPVANKITNCNFIDFGNAGIYGYRVIGSTLNTEPSFQGSIYAVNCYFELCNYGIYLDQRSEYNTFVGCRIARAMTAGIRVIGGNNYFIGGSATRCVIAFQMTTSTNDGHGGIFGFSFNHSSTAISATGIVNGYNFDNCFFYDGSVTLSNCARIKFTNCEFSSSVGNFSFTNCTDTEFINAKWVTNPANYTVVSGAAPTHINGNFVTGTIPAGMENSNPRSGVVAKTANYTITTSDIGRTFKNTGASGTVNLTLPTASEGLWYEFYIDAAQSLTITAGASTTIRIAGSASASAGNITSNTVGNFVKLKAISSTQWIAETTQGTWTVN
jgi:hypothetical protein